MCISRPKAPDILVMMTGGTICSSTNADGLRYSNAADVKIVDSFQKGPSPFAGDTVFEPAMPLNILSENMTIKTWNALLDALRQVDFRQYKGIIILHGTDTLAYTASLLSIVLSGIPIPVILVSAQLPLYEDGTNGHANFRAATELIMNGIAPNVYAVYKNSDGVIYTHLGSQLLQCANYSQDFFSPRPMVIPDPNNAQLPGIRAQTNTLYLRQMGALSACVLSLVPYVGMNYNGYCLDGIRAVVHGTYHSESVCVERSNGTGEYSSASILHLMDRCKKQDIPLFLAPCSPQAFAYESTGDILAHGACYMTAMTNEMAYVKALVGCALKLSGEELKTFVNTQINYEKVY